MINDDDKKWWLFKGEGEPRPGAEFPPPPPWRSFGLEGGDSWMPRIAEKSAYWNRARSYRVDPRVVEAINAALWLRRPLLVTGMPGSGKTSLIYRVAYELDLGPVLEWPVNSRSRLKDGLYEYDALAHLQDHQLKRSGELGRYISLGALGTALLPANRPRALLIDEIDKADPDLPNDLLNLFEEGTYGIPELIRERAKEAWVRPKRPSGLGDDPSKDRDVSSESVKIVGGTVRCTEFPFIVLTSNGEREFPPAFLRRCIRIDLKAPDEKQIERVVSAHLGTSAMAEAMERIQQFAQNGTGKVALDQFLNALHLVHEVPTLSADARGRIETLLMQAITRS